MRYLRAAVIVTMAASSLLVASTPAAAAPSWCDDATIDAKDLPEQVPMDVCDMAGKVIREGLLGVVVPAPGSGRSGTLTLAPGSPDGNIELSLRRDPDGKLTVQRAAKYKGGVDEIVPGDEGGSNNECTNGHYRRLPDGRRFTHDMNYWYNPDVAPTNFTHAEWLQSIRRAEVHMSGGENICALAMNPPIAGVYRGTTATNVNINPDSAFCPAGDSNSVVAWLVFPAGNPIIAGTCSEVDGAGAIRGSDVAINTRQTFWRSDITGCQDAFDLEAVMTHEFGHSYGLADMTTTIDDDLTMFGSAGFCETGKRSLGLGDLLGMNVIY